MAIKKTNYDTYIKYNIPNSISIFRLIGALILYCSYSHISNAMSVVLFMLLGFTDIIDGYLARKFKCESSLGYVLDKFADKILIIGALIFLEQYNFLYCFLIVGFLYCYGREFILKETNKLNINAYQIKFDKIVAFLFFIIIAVDLSNIYKNLDIFYIIIFTLYLINIIIYYKRIEV
tara:strand:+ start:656 stop:1186 length:531 start_codon:yes stop_codon:yes gene_type:complete